MMHDEEVIDGLLDKIEALKAELRRQHSEIKTLEQQVTCLQDKCDALKAERDELRKELEEECMRHIACGVIAMANTPESAKKVRDMHPAYRSASVRDVENAVDREMALRAERDALRDALKKIKSHVDTTEYAYEIANAAIDAAREEKP